MVMVMVIFGLQINYLITLINVLLILQTVVLIVLYVEQDVNFMWQSCLGLKN